MIFLGIRREKRFSPNRIDGDKAIFDSVGGKLQTSEDLLFRMSEDELVRDGAGDISIYDAVFHMCRSDRALSLLQQVEDSGVPVINSPRSVINCRRIREVELLSGTDVPFVESSIIQTDSLPETWTSFPCWVKRGDTHSLQADDVIYAATRQQCEEALQRMSGNGISNAVIQKHIEGHIVKFYGVGRGLLFKYRFLENVGEGKFGLESHNRTGKIPVDETSFAESVSSIAGILGTDVYGGDAIVTDDGNTVIIDFNDWPSFFICREEAAETISSLIKGK